jgi:hypothetical protein
LATGFWQSVRCPLLVTEQGATFFPLAPLLGDALGAADGLEVGVADALTLGAGAVAASAIPLNDSVPAAIRISTDDNRRMPGG